MLFIAPAQCQDLFLVLKLWICKWDFYEDLCVILCFSWKLLPLPFPGDATRVYQKTDTPTSFPILKNKEQEKLSRRWKRNTFKKQVGVKRGLEKRKRGSDTAGARAVLQAGLQIHHCSVRPKLAVDTHAGRAGANLNQGCPSPPFPFSFAFPFPAAPGQQAWHKAELGLASAVTCQLDGSPPELLLPQSWVTGVKLMIYVPASSPRTRLTRIDLGWASHDVDLESKTACRHTALVQCTEGRMLRAVLSACSRLQDHHYTSGFFLLFFKCSAITSWDTKLPTRQPGSKWIFQWQHHDGAPEPIQDSGQERCHPCRTAEICLSLVIERH